MTDRPDVTAFLGFINALPGPKLHELPPEGARMTMIAMRDVADSRALLIEPDPRNLDLGRRNFALNDMSDRATFVHGVIGDQPRSVTEFAGDDGTMFSLDQYDLHSLMDGAGVNYADLVLSDIQGGETVLLERALGRLRSRPDPLLDRIDASSLDLRQPADSSAGPRGAHPSRRAHHLRALGHRVLQRRRVSSRSRSTRATRTCSSRSAAPGPAIRCSVSRSSISPSPGSASARVATGRWAFAKRPSSSGERWTRRAR